ncbi:FxSxx-COOH system tetratricopeptide repeat protein [Nonomuraea sp. NPDC049421]|uniref:FxSxx-COOH system tetratricopeptide repeat protein n=1 Tax=Nonomuraea sp. NPDC049421 TaxID=3155275 RepID=UPI0034326990
MIGFFSTRAGLGRTMALCNCALLLAEAGKRVLVLDEEPQAPALRHYLSRFLPERPGEPRTAGPGDWSGLEIAVDLPGQVVRHAVLTGEEIDAAAPYDYVLVNLRPGAEPSPVIRSCDSAVVCFWLSPYGIDEAAAMARQMRAAGTPVVPLPTMVSHEGEDLLRTARQRATAGFGTDIAVEVPYDSAAYFSDDLAVLTEPPGSGGTQRAAYERLVELLSGGAVTTLRHVSIVYVPGYDVWAEWIAAQLDLWGVRAESLTKADYLSRTPVDLLAGDAHTAVLVIGPPGEPSGLDWQRRGGRAAPLPGRGLIRVLVDGKGAGAAPAGEVELDLCGLHEAEAAAELQATLGVGGAYVAGGEGTGTARFPGRGPALSELPQRDEGFTGRQALLTQLRAQLGPRWDGTGRCVVTGPAGRGKSALALEYAHRFRSAYDVVHWLHAEDAYSAREGLRRLGQELGLPPREDAVTVLKEHLASPESGRWLLVFDEADRPDAIAGLVPQGPYGHVIVNSRATGWPGDFSPVEVGKLAAADAVELLTSGDELLSESGAAKVAATVEHLPLALSMARAWMERELTSAQRPRRTIDDLRTITVDRFLFTYHRIRRDLREQGRPDDVHAVMVELMLDLLRGVPGGEGAPWLLEALTFVSSDGVPLSLAHSTASRDYAVALIGEYGDGLMVDALLRLLHEHALARAEPGPGGRLRVHRVTASLVRARMPAAQVEERRRQVLSLLARHAPADTEGPDAGMYLELGRHVFPSGAIECGEEMVRRWIIGQVRFLFLLGDRSAWDKAVAIGDRALRSWTAPGTEARPDLVNRLRMELANVYRVLDRPETAYALSGQALQELSGDRRGHPLRYIAAQVHAADLRAVGDFDEAYHWDSVAYEGMHRVFGPDHEWTSKVLNSLALSASLNGRPHRAYELARQRMDRRRALFGERDLGLWRTALTAGVLLRDLGRYQESYDLLRAGLDHLASRSAKGDPRTLLMLRMQSSLAAAERMLGRPFEALARDRETLEELRSLVGGRHLYALLCQAGFAADLHARGEHADAAGNARHVADGLAAMQAEHPFTHAARVNLAIYLAAAGADTEALEPARQAYEALRRRLGTRHPYTLAAAVTLAGRLVAHEPAEALVMEERAWDCLARTFGPEHPRTLAVQENLTNTRRRLVGHPGAEAGVRHAAEIEILGN